MHHRCPCPRLWPSAGVARLLGRFPRLARHRSLCADGRCFGGTWTLAAAFRVSPTANVGRAVARLRRR
ncbi:MutT/NUDIX family protein [Actinomyces sp. oral taxon 180 str. F0310]|nr:MutT/NUDIX family protein [Actinomyces sp. oral taxon 180 str. F0310]